MLRLAHRILDQREIVQDDLDAVFCDGGFYSLDDAQILFQRVKTNVSMNIPVIIADNVATHWNELSKAGKVGNTLEWEDVPPCPPPFSRCLIEWNCPEIIYSRHFGKLYEFKRTGRCGYKQGGVLLQVNSKRKDDNFDPWIEAFHTKEAISASHWQMIGVILSTCPNGRVTVLGRLGLMLDELGTIIERRLESMFAPLLDEHFPVVGLTLAFMQCKNVNRIDVSDLEGPPPGWRKRKRLPLVKYHVLKIDPNIGRKLRSGERKTEGDRSGKALHICRGYFMHCVNDGVNKGLFGKGIYGTFWVPSHVRGTADLGQVIPTYNVLAPTG